jgi:hypothetical protein
MIKFSWEKLSPHMMISTNYKDNVIVYLDDNTKVNHDVTILAEIIC